MLEAGALDENGLAELPAGLVDQPCGSGASGSGTETCD
jgi:hypothetical protein